jgi:hypothetical protein
MDRVTALVAIAHLKLRLELIERNPQLLEGLNMEIRRPMELAGLKGRLARAQKQEADIAVTGQRFDGVLDRIDELHSVSRSHVGQLEQQENDLRSTIERMTGGSNGGPNEPSESLTVSSAEVGQIITSRTE